MPPVLLLRLSLLLSRRISGIVLAIRGSLRTNTACLQITCCVRSTNLIWANASSLILSYLFRGGLGASTICLNSKYSSACRFHD